MRFDGSMLDIEECQSYGISAIRMRLRDLIRRIPRRPSHTQGGIYLWRVTEYVGEVSRSTGGVGWGGGGGVGGGGGGGGGGGVGGGGGSTRLRRNRRRR